MLQPQKLVSPLNTSFDISLLAERTVLAQGGMVFPGSETGAETNNTKFILFFPSFNPWKLYPIFFQPCSQEQKGCGSLSKIAQTCLFQRRLKCFMANEGAETTAWGSHLMALQLAA